MVRGFVPRGANVVLSAVFSCVCEVRYSLCFIKWFVMCHLFWGDRTSQVVSGHQCSSWEIERLIFHCSLLLSVTNMFFLQRRVYIMPLICSNEILGSHDFGGSI